MPAFLVDNQRAQLLRLPLPNHFSLLIPILIEETLSALHSFDFRLNAVQYFFDLLARNGSSIVARFHIDQLLLDHGYAGELQTDAEKDKQNPDDHQVDQLGPVDVRGHAKIALIHRSHPKVHH